MRTFGEVGTHGMGSRVWQVGIGMRRGARLALRVARMGAGGTVVIVMRVKIVRMWWLVVDELVED